MGLLALPGCGLMACWLLGVEPTFIYERESLSGRSKSLFVLRATGCGAKEPVPARASAAAAPMTTVRPAAEPWLAVVVRLDAARKLQRLAANWELLRPAGAEMAASACALALWPTAAEAPIPWAAGYPEAEKLSEVLLQLNQTSLSQLRRDHETGHLEHKIANASK